MEHQELINLQPGALIKITSELFVWDLNNWDGIQERNGIFLKHFGASLHIQLKPDPAQEAVIRAFYSGRPDNSIGTTRRSIKNTQVIIIQILQDNKVQTLEADPEFVEVM